MLGHVCGSHSQAEVEKWPQDAPGTMEENTTAKQEQQQQHVVAVPLPLQGHVNALMRFCKLLAQHAAAGHHPLLITFVHIDSPTTAATTTTSTDSHPDEPASAPAAEDGCHLHPSPSSFSSLPPPPTAPPFSSSSSSSSCAPASSAEAPSIRCARIPLPAGQPNSSDDFGGPVRFLHETQLPAIAPSLHRLILSLDRHGPPVTCLLSDFGITFPTQDVADQLGIPRICLSPFSASQILFVHYIAEGRHLPIEGVMEAVAAAGELRREVFCRGLPGLPSLFNSDIPHFKHGGADDTRYVLDLARRSWQACNTRAHAVVVNSFEDLEASAFRALSKCTEVPIYGVGPWVEPLGAESGTSFWEEDGACMTWLDQQPTASVLYISFGSLTVLSRSQFEEILSGVVASKQRFLWVVRAGLVASGPTPSTDSAVRADIMSRSEGRGLVVSWAPQLEVLSHSAVGAFLTHCGWNSVMEAIALGGLPMLCWPYFADQSMNARCMVEEWKVGLSFQAFKEEGDENVFFVGRCEIERGINSVMQERGEGKLLRKTVTRLREACRQRLSAATQGDLHEDLISLIRSLKDRQSCFV